MKKILIWYGVLPASLKKASVRDLALLTILALAIPFASLTAAGIFGYAVLFFTGYRILAIIVGLVFGLMIFLFEKSSFQVTTLSQALQRIYISFAFVIMVIPMKVELSSDDLIQARVNDHKTLVVEMRRDSADAMLKLLDDEKEVMTIQADAGKAFKNGEGMQGLHDARRLVENFEFTKTVRLDVIAQKYSSQNVTPLDTSKMTLLTDYVENTLANRDPMKKWFDIVFMLFIFVMESLPGLVVLLLLKDRYVKNLRHIKGLNDKAEDHHYSVESKILDEDGDPEVNTLDLQISNLKMRYAEGDISVLEEISKLSQIKKMLLSGSQSSFYQRLEDVDESPDGKEEKKTSKKLAQQPSQNGQAGNSINPFKYDEL